MKIIKKLLKILLIFFALFGLVIFVFTVYASIPSDECSKGPLGFIQECKTDSSSSLLSFQSSGWWYEDATGDLKREICDEIRGKAEKITFKTSEKETGLYKVNCQLFGIDEKNICYASQRLSANGNSRFVNILINTGECGARYFSGSKVNLIDDKPHVVDDWSTPYKNIPERPIPKD
jgi:hypothetical protein